jgi:hypothetical protein
MNLEFIEKNTLGGGWSLEVRRSAILLGHIRRRPDTGAYRYFRGPHNELTPCYENTDLEALKDRIKTHP